MEKCVRMLVEILTACDLNLLRTESFPKMVGEKD